MRLVFDIEANNLLDTVTKVHTLVAVDLDTGEQYTYTPDQIEEGLALLSKASALYAHNGIRYDLPVLHKLYGWAPAPDTKVFDTLVMVRLRFAHVQDQDFEMARAGKFPAHLAGSQGIEAWGWRLGEKKIDYKAWCESQGIEDPWALWTPQMTDYCLQDVLTNVALVHHLRAMGVPQEALALEHELAWYLARQEQNGWPVHTPNLLDLIGTLAARKAELEVALVNHFGTWQVPRDSDEDGNHIPFVPRANNAKLGYEAGVPILRWVEVTFNPNSRHHIVDRLQTLYGWTPKDFTPSGQPKLDETILQGLDIPVAKELEEYLLVSKRLGQVSEGKEAWTKHMTEDGLWGGKLTDMAHIHHSIGATTVTHRHRHSSPNLGQVPAAHSPYGKECRSVFTVPKGWKLVGSDASGLELRCLAHYMARYDDGAYGDIILNGRKEDGTDIHSQNAKAVGQTRDEAKTTISNAGISYGQP